MSSAAMAHLQKKGRVAAAQRLPATAEADTSTTDLPRRYREATGDKPEVTELTGNYPNSFFPLYDIAMDQETINGAPVTEDHIAAWAAEAEQGFDVDALKKRGRGRPGRGAEPSQVVALRLTADELAAIDAIAARAHKTRSEAIREALAAYVA